MRLRPIRFTRFLPRTHPPRNRSRTIHILHKPVCNQFSLPVVSNTLRDKLFRETSQARRSDRAISACNTFLAWLLFHRIARAVLPKVIAAPVSDGRRSTVEDFDRRLKRP